MKKVSLRETQEVLLELLKIIDRICRANDIPYWIDHGTLLGAVRQKAFIAWDDDVDLCVMQSEYPKLLSLLEEECKINEDIFLLYNNNTHVQYWCEYLCTTKLLWGTKQSDLGPCRIDIFPMKSMSPSQENEDRKITDVAKYFVDGKVIPSVDKKHMKNDLKQALHEKETFMNFYNNEYMTSLTEKNPNSLITFSYGDSISKYPDYFLYSDIFPLQEIEFEGVMLLAPNNIDKYLHILYGDYMTPPPKSKQKPFRSKFYTCPSRQIAHTKAAIKITEQYSSFYYYTNLYNNLFWHVKKFLSI